MKTRKKGFSISAIAPIAITIVVAVVVLGFGAQILGQIYTSQITPSSNSSFEANITRQGLTGLKTLGDWIPTIVLIVVLAIIIGIIYTYLSGKKNGSM
jgi:NADH:ubiquinone oxidoreductase subunit 3 (subunit A)